MASRPLPVSRLRAKRKKRRLMALISIFVSLLVLMAVVVGLSWLPQVRIHGVEVVGASSVSVERIQDTVRGELGGTQGLVFARDNIFLYAKAAIEKKLLKTFPVFEKVEVHSDGFQAIKITVVEREARALWCGESPSDASACFLLDGSGVAYAPAADFTGGVYIKYFGEVSTSTPKRYLDPDRFQAIGAFVSAVRAPAQQAPVSVVVSGDEADITFVSGFILKYMVTNDTAEVLERFALALKSEPFAQHSVSNFEYLDLRFGDKLYYKLKAL